MTRCAYPGCPSTGTHEHEGKDYCSVHYAQKVAAKVPGALRLPLIGRVDVTGREN